MELNLKVEPIGFSYRIIVANNERPIVFEADLPLETMEEICRAMEERYRQAYKAGWADGYSEGWKDGYYDEPMRK